MKFTSYFFNYDYGEHIAWFTEQSQVVSWHCVPSLVSTLSHSHLIILPDVFVNVDTLVQTFNFLVLHKSVSFSVAFSSLLFFSWSCFSLSLNIHILSTTFSLLDICLNLVVSNDYLFLGHLAIHMSKCQLSKLQSCLLGISTRQSLPDTVEHIWTWKSSFPLNFILLLLWFLFWINPLIVSRSKWV